MAINQTCLESEIQTAVDNLTTSCSAEVFLETAIAADNANTNRKFSVALGCQLPDLETASIPPGTMVYVEELGVPVVSTLQAWKGLDGRTYRKDITFYQVYSWGRNSEGQSGTNLSGINYSSPVQETSSNTSWCHITNGLSTIAIKSDNTLWGWGRNTSGELGIGNVLNYSSPVQEITSSTNWCYSSTYLDYTLALKSDNTLWGWGSNIRGKLGIAGGNASSPVQESTSSTNWFKVSVGNDHSVALKNSGEIYSWGCGACGTFGNNSTLNYSTPVQEITSASNWCNISAGENQAGAVKTTGELYMWGIGDRGRLGDNTVVNRSSPVQEISSSTNWCLITTGLYHTMALKTDGTLWGWGSDYFGQIGDGTTFGGLSCGYSSPAQEICSATNWSMVSAHGTQQTSAIKTDGSLWSWGWNGSGQLAQGNTTNSCSPVQEITSGCWCFVSSGNCYISAIKVV